MFTAIDTTATSVLYSNLPPPPPPKVPVPKPTSDDMVWQYRVRQSAVTAIVIFPVLIGYGYLAEHAWRLVFG
jgi:hypothetical protein